MKNSKLRRVLMLLACAVLLVSLSVGATLAYLTSTTEVVENSFTVGKVKIILDEACVDSRTGEMITPDERTTQNTYHLMPGHNYWKDPTVHVDVDSEDCYVFVKVENGIAAIEAPDSEFTKTIASQMTANGWVALPGVNDVYYYTKYGNAWTQNAGENLVVFTNFTVNPQVVNGLEEGEVRDPAKLYLADYTTEENDVMVTVIAYAIQADGFNTPAEAWVAGNFQ